MSRASQRIREGFRRIGVVCGAFLGLVVGIGGGIGGHVLFRSAQTGLDALPIIGAIVGGAIGAWIGFHVGAWLARSIGWVIAGFFD